MELADIQGVAEEDAPDEDSDEGAGNGGGGPAGSSDTDGY